MKRKKRTKIIATIGPASESLAMLTEMSRCGMDVARLNFSHGDLTWHRTIIRRLREVSRRLKRPIGIMADLQGPRIRIANTRPLAIKTGEEVLVYGVDARPEEQLRRKAILLDLTGAERLIRASNEILIEDGLLRLKVIGKRQRAVRARVLDGGIVRPHKGVNIPGISAHLSALTRRDRAILDFALKEDVDFIALSFVRSASEIKRLRRIIGRSVRTKSLPQIVAKIERREAVKNFSDILKTADVIMVARGDLGIEMPQADLPILQKEIVGKCLRSAKPVIVATQMLDSMIRNPRPTRAEISDVSNAVIDHADAVMLSGETAHGRYPLEAIKVMSEIAEKTEHSPYDDLGHGFLGDQRASISAAIAQSAHELAKDSRVRAIVVASTSGFTARMIVRHRPDEDIFVVTNLPKTQRQLSLVWGVQAILLPECRSLDALIDRSAEVLRRGRHLRKGDRVVIVTGRPHLRKEHMSLVKIEEIR